MLPSFAVFLEYLPPPLQAHPNAKKWRKTPFPLFDDLGSLVDGTAATGEGAYHPGQPSSSMFDLSDTDNDSEVLVSPDISSR